MKNNNVLIKDFKNFDYGFLKCAEAVFQTYGVEGKLGVIQNGSNPGYYSKDGISLAKAVRFSNLTASAGAVACITGASRTLALTQDSTTLSCILMHALVSKMDRSKFTKKVEAGIYVAAEEVYNHLKKLSKKANKNDLKQIAKVAVNAEESLADLITDAFNYSGNQGIIEVIMDSALEKSVFEKREGLLLKSHGFTSPYFANREDKKLAFESEQVAVICAAVWEYTPSIITTIQNFYQDKPRSTPLIVFLERSNSDFTEKLIGIKQVGFNVCVVSCGSYDEHTSETLLNDIAAYTGASVFNPRNSESKIIFGLADKVVSTVESTTLLNIDVPENFKNLVQTLESAENRDEQRIKMLTTRASLIRVGGLTPLDIQERFDRCEDGVGSIKSSTAEGIIAGGGATLAHISGLMDTRLDHKEKQVGYDLIKWALTQPMVRMLTNANRYQPKWYQPWKDDYLKSAKDTYGVGYNASFDEISNLIEDGIVDSKKSIRVAIESSIEQSIKVLSLAVIIHDPTEMTLD